MPFDILIGSLPLMDDYDVEVSVAEREKILSWQRQAKSVVLVAVRFSGVRDYTASGMFSLSDPPRSDALRVISDIKKRGIDVEMVTGDNEITAQAVAMELNISPDCVHAGVGPEEKAEVIRQLQARMRKPHKNQIVRWWRGLRRGKSKQKEVVMFVGGKVPLIHYSLAPSLTRIQTESTILLLWQRQTSQLRWVTARNLHSHLLVSLSPLAIMKLSR